MSTDVYAGQLCATHVNEWVAHPKLDPYLKWWLAEIGHSERYCTVKLVCKGVNFDLPPDGRRGTLPKSVKILRLDPDEILTFSVR